MRKINNMFGLNNFAGSCWVNACLQGIFRLPELIDRYSDGTYDKENPVDASLNTIWNSQGKDGLREFFKAVRNATMPAGQGIGDSNELLVYLCDKLPALDKLCRYTVAEKLHCSLCDFTQTKEDSIIEFDLHPLKRQTPIGNCIVDSMVPEKLEDWKCDKCSQKGGATKQRLIGTFPKVMVFRNTSMGSSLQYSSVLVLNSKKYYLLSVISHNGGHWWSYAREMPPGRPWFTLDDTRVMEHTPTQFPLSESMRVLIYYRLDE
jgi:ubiquitin C-terminal hydrolase